MSRFLEGMLFGIQPMDQATLISVIVLFVLVVSLASCIPARWATGVDPLVAPRSE